MKQQFNALEFRLCAFFGLPKVTQVYPRIDKVNLFGAVGKYISHFFLAPTGAQEVAISVLSCFKLTIFIILSTNHHDDFGMTSESIKQAFRENSAIGA